MDQLFGGDDPPKKPNRNNQPDRVPNPRPVKQNKKKNNTGLQDKAGEQEGEKKQKKQGEGDDQSRLKQTRKDRGRAKKQKQQQKRLQQLKKKVTEELQLPLIIKMHRSLSETEQTEMNLEQFIDHMYPEEDNPQSSRNKIIKPFEKEKDQGNIEYKLKLIKPSEDRLDHLATQMKFRLNEGFGEAYYRVGVEDGGRATGLAKDQMYESLKTICTIANKIHADIMAVRISQGIKGNIVELMVTKKQKQGVKLQIRVLLMGESNSGKSTLLGVIKSGEYDDGKGYSRTKVFTHKDEFMSGITQTKSHHIIAFDSKGRLFNNQTMVSFQSWLENSSKILSFIDVGGHKQKQVVSSLCSFFPEYALWIVSGVKQIQNTSCIELAKIFHLPLIVVVTHLDKLDKEGEMDTVIRIKKTLKELYPDKAASVINSMQNAVLFSRITSTEQVIPIFLTSSVTGKNLDLLINFFNLLTSTNELRNNQDMHAEFLISNIFNLEKNIVLAGTVIKGTIKKGQILHLGPDIKGSFRAVEVDSIECMRVPVKLAKCGQVCTIAIKLLSYAKQWIQRQPNAIRRGMVLIESKSNPKATHQFTASFMPYSRTSQQVKITAKYQPVINTLTTRQICDIIIMTSNNDLDLDLPLGLQSKKKSKSIDMFEQKAKSATHHNSNSSAKCLIKKGKSFAQEEKPEEQLKIFQKKKQSEDLTNTYNPPSKNPHTQSPVIKKEKLGLEPIQETKQQGKLKKKKIDRDIEIRFSNNEPTTLRLRFKYYPEYLEHGQKLVINELKLIGQVTQLHY